MEDGPTPFEKARSMILALSPCSPVFHRDWIDRVVPENYDKVPPNDRRRDIIPIRNEFHRFLDDVLLNSGWMEEFTLPLSNGKVGTYIRGHPVFTNTVRTFPNSQLAHWRQKYTKDVWFIFGNYNYERVERQMRSQCNTRNIVDIEGTDKQRAVITWELLGRDITLKTQVEAANYLQSFSQLLQEKEYVYAGLILQLLWDAAVRSRTPALSTEMLLVYATNFHQMLTELLQKYPDENVPNLQGVLLAVVDLSVVLYRFYVQKNPSVGGGFAKAGIELALEYGGEVNVWDAHLVEQVVMLLLSYGLSLILIGEEFAAGKGSIPFRSGLDTCFESSPVSSTCTVCYNVRTGEYRVQFG